MDLIAARRMTYGTRRLLPGDRFTVSGRDARILIAIQKAKAAPDGSDVAPEDPLAALRKEYQEVLGKRPFHGWDAEMLQEKIAEARDAN